MTPFLKNVFEEINLHLLEKVVPSQYMNQLSELPFFKKEPFAMLERLKETEQSPVHHPEGNVWIHTMLVLDNAAKIKAESSDQRVFMWAALLHDIGKPDTTRVRKGRITAYDHDKAGYELSKKFLKALTDETEFIEKVARLVRWHMQMLFVLRNLPYANLEAMKKQTDIKEVGLWGFCDRMGRLHADRKEEEKNLLAFLEICTGA